MTKPNPKDFMLMDRKGETITREPGSINGYDFVIDGCENSEIRLLDRTAQIQLDYCKDSKILIGPVGGSIFARNCERCTIIAACQQLRTRECVDCDIILLIPGHPIIETSHNIRFGEMPRDLYPELESQMAAAGLTIAKNDWNHIYDFSPENPAGVTHYTLNAAEETAKVLAAFPARPGTAKSDPSTTAAAAPNAQGQPTDVADTREVRVTAKRNAQFHAGLCKTYLGGKPAADGKPELAPCARVVLAAAGDAVGTAGHAAILLENEGVAKVISISTDMVKLGSEAGRQREVPSISIVLEKKSM